MGTSMVGENGVWGEYEDDRELSPARRSAVARERTSLAEDSSGGVTIEEVEGVVDEAELESGGGEG